MTDNNNQATTGDQVEILAPSAATRTQVIGVDDYTFTFEQKPLSFMGKMQLFGVLGSALDKVIGKDGQGVSIADLLEVPERGDGGFSPDDFKDADTFVRALSRLVSYAPETLGDLYCILLAVPMGQRATIKRIMELPEDEGGLSDEDGVGMLRTFVAQNWDVMVDFFKGPLGGLLADVKAKMPKKPLKEEAADLASASSTLSKSTPPTTDAPPSI